ncbi:chemotaxis protein CheC [Ampullimonas aquatilis]|uniref:chemotaxis protein CheC n=1 Tax=Ampullimonas aquatilis TaxID=1341549 RepID=UPI003C72AC4F
MSHDILMPEATKQDDLPVQLTELQLDALAETFNLSLGEAAEVFSQIVADRIDLSVPTVELVSREQLIEYLAQLHGRDGTQRICGISQAFEDHQDFHTETVLLFPERGCLEIVRRMLGDAVHVDNITELEQDALAEIGNIIINSCMNSLSNLFQTELLGTLPRIVFIQGGETYVEGETDRNILLARIGMSLSSENVTGYVLFIMDLPSIRSFVNKIESLFGIS